MAGLADKYRPRELAELVGQPKAVATLERFRAASGGRAYWISGVSGSGKTTLAKIIAGWLCDDFFVEELTGRELTPALVRRLAEGLRWHSMSSGGRSGRAVIINEAHGIGRAALEVLLDATDSGAIPAHSAWIFTTTRAGEERLFDDQIDASPLLSRCVELRLTTQGLARAFAARALEIARAEGLDGGATEATLYRLAQECRNNMRELLTTIESGALLRRSVEAA